jgi:hypothetical protein
VLSASEVRWFWTAAKIIKSEWGTENCALKMYKIGSQHYTRYRLLVLFVIRLFPVSRRHGKRMSLWCFRTWSWVQQVLPKGCKQSTIPHDVILKSINLFTCAFQISGLCSNSSWCSLKCGELLYQLDYCSFKYLRSWIPEYIIRFFQYIILGSKIRLLLHSFQHPTQINIQR